MSEVAEVKLSVSVKDIELIEELLKLLVEEFNARPDDYRILKDKMKILFNKYGVDLDETQE
jgi:hypothetical protein